MLADKQFFSSVHVSAFPENRARNRFSTSARNLEKMNETNEESLMLHGLLPLCCLPLFDIIKIQQWSIFQYVQDYQIVGEPVGHLGNPWSNTLFVISVLI